VRKIDVLLTEYAEDVVNSMTDTGFSGINIIEKILRDPGISTQGSKHRVLYWHRNKRIAKMSKAMHHVSQRGQLCLIVKYGRIVKEDGQILTRQEFSRFMKFKNVKVFNEAADVARNILIPLMNKK